MKPRRRTVHELDGRIDPVASTAPVTDSAVNRRQPLFRSGMTHASRIFCAALWAQEEAQALPYRILVVEDEPDVRDLLDFTLRAAGHRVDSVTSGRDALELLADHSYDVILSDLRMPEMTGEDLYRRIEQGWPHLAPRVAFVSASSPSDDFQAQYGGRSVPLITKPYTHEELLRVVDDVGARDV